MRRMIISLIVLSAFLFLYGCTSQRYYEDDPSAYGSWNQTVNKIRDDSFCGSLPDKQDVSEFVQSYYYVFSQGVFGDPNFVIYVALQFPDENSYEEEINKYALLLSDPIQMDGFTYYPVQCSKKTFEEYTDNQTLDGMYYNFEIIVENKDAKMISFINAHVWDYYKDQMLVDFLNQIYHTRTDQ